MADSLESRFWPKVDKSGDCWEWKAGTFESGYGRIHSPDGWSEMAHRVAYRLTYGRPENNVLHKCDNKLCVNPSHLYDGTPRDNQLDIKQHWHSGKISDRREKDE